MLKLKMLKMFLAMLPVLLTTLPAVATMLPADMDILVSSAESVVTGRVVSLDSYWLDGTGSIIVTDVGFEVDEVWMGSKQKPGEKISVRIIGGEVGDIGMRQQHQPTFKMEEEAILFLKVRGDGELGIAQAEQGVFRAHDDKLWGHLTEIKTLSGFRTSLEDSKKNHGRQ